jgi:flavin-dependent dehydrogenase
VRDNVLLTGDAARFCIPLSGAGIGNAMLSGMHAGGVASSFLDGKLELSAYQVAMENLLYKKLKKAYKFKQKILMEDGFNRLYHLAGPLLSLHNVFPRITEHFALKNFRF